MADCGGQYQVCGLNAFNRYGWDEQVPNRVCAYNDKLSGDLQIGPVRSAAVQNQFRHELQPGKNQKTHRGQSTTLGADVLRPLLNAYPPNQLAAPLPTTRGNLWLLR